MGRSEVTYLGSAPRQPTTHAIDNNLPILQEPADRHQSVLDHVMGGQSIEFTCEALSQRLGDTSITPTVTRRVNAQIHDWIRTQGKHDELFNNFLRVGRSEEDPARGHCVFAAGPGIRKFQVLGLYSGALWDLWVRGKEASSQWRFFRDRENEVLGTQIRTYLFGEDGSDYVIDAYQRGNVLSLVNTAKLPGQASGSSKENNVVACSLGGVLFAYIATRNIEKGEEILLDYGVEFNPRLDACRHHIRAKTEPSSDSVDDTDTTVMCDLNDLVNSVQEAISNQVKDPNGIKNLIERIGGIHLMAHKLVQSSRIALNVHFLSSCVTLLFHAKLQPKLARRLSIALADAIKKSRVFFDAKQVRKFFSELANSGALGMLQSESAKDSPHGKLFDAFDELLGQMDEICPGVTFGARISQERA